MATPGTEVDLLPKAGTEADSQPRGSFAQNLLWADGSLFTRPGLGQIAEFTTTMGLPLDPSSNFGYVDLVGSRGIVTDAGHVQIVTVCLADSFSGDELGVGASGRFVTVSVYDVTTDSRWEIVLHKPTSSFFGSTFDQSHWRGCYESSFTYSRESWLMAESIDNLWFEPFDGELLFGSPEIGVWVYRPSVFNETRRQQIDSARENDWVKGYAESSLVSRISPADGLFSEGFTYLNSDSFPAPVDCVAMGDRIVYVSGREVFFTDKLKPQSIMGSNGVFVPSARDLVAVEYYGDVLYLFSPDECWAYQPYLNDAIVTGKLVQVDSSIGALSCSAVVRTTTGLFTVDRNGVHGLSSALAFSPADGGIGLLFDQAGISNPLTNYYQANGHSDLTEAQPRLSYRMAGALRPHLAYDSLYKLLILTLPDQNVSFVLQSGDWFVWNYESISSNTPALVQAQRNIMSPRVVPVDGRVFVTSGIERYTPVDVTVEGGDVTAMNLNAMPGSYVILELGRGGALDRSVDASEDRRAVAGYYVRHNPLEAGEIGRYYLNPPVKMPAGYLMPTNPIARGEVYLFPLTFVHDSPGAISHLNLHFRYDNTAWQPVFIDETTSAVVDAVFPPERFGSISGWGQTPGPPTTTHQIRTWNPDGVPIVVRGGRELQIDWDGVAGEADLGGAGPYWTHGPYMNLNKHHEEALLWLPFEKVNASDDVMCLGFEWVSSYYEEPAVIEAEVHAWRHPAPGRLHAADDVAQPVDWVYRSGNVELGGQHLARRLLMSLVTRGRASAPLFPNWIHGLLNIVGTSDYSGWSGQILDYTAAPERVRRIVDAAVQQARILDAAGLVAKNRFGADGRWGSAGTPADGNILIGDVEWDHLAISDALKGESTAWMIFGHVRSRAESLGLTRVVGSYRKLGGLRIWGRS